MTVALHETSTFNVRASFNQWIKDALANIILPHSVTYTFVDTWPETTMPTPAISVIHGDIGRSSEYLGRLVSSTQRGVEAAALADVSVWVSRRNTNWQAQLNILMSAVEAVFTGTISAPVRNYITNAAAPSTTEYVIRIINLDMGDTSPDVNPDIMRTRSLLRYEWTLRSNVS
jgi:hypothetical protein